MASVINAGTTTATALNVTTDTTGALNIQTSGTNAISINNAQVVSLTNPLLPASGGTGINSLGTGVATFLGTPTSANLAAAVTNETGSGSLVFATSPSLTTPTIAGGALSGNFSGTPTFTGDVVTFGSTGAIKLPASTTANRPAAVTGMVRFNTDFLQFEGYNGSAWSGIGGGATGGGANQVFFENDQVVSTNYTN